MRYLVRESVIEVVGRIWMPGTVAAQRLTPDAVDVANMRNKDGAITRESVQDWLDTHAGDFAEIIDFSASIEDGDQTVEIDYADEENGLTYGECMFPEPEED